MSDWYPTHLAIGGRIPQCQIDELIAVLSEEKLTVEELFGFSQKPLSRQDFLDAADGGECLRVGKDNAYYGTAPVAQRKLSDMGIEFVMRTDCFNVNNRPTDLVAKDLLVVHKDGELSDYYYAPNGKIFLDNSEKKELRAKGMSDSDIELMLARVPRDPDPVVIV